MPIEVPLAKGKTKIFDQDEHVRENTSMEALAKLRPVLGPEFTVTAGNASGINDGASAMLLMNESTAGELGIRPIARIVSIAVSCNEVHLFGVSPAFAIQKALEKAGLTLSDIDLIEINEAFAAQCISVERELNLDHDTVNVNGGAVALGHALGNSGTRISITLIHELIRRGLQLGVSSICIGGGQGLAVVWEILN